MYTGGFLTVLCVAIVFVQHVPLSFGTNFKTTIRPPLHHQSVEIGTERQFNTVRRSSPTLRHYNIDTRDDTEYSGQSDGSPFSFWMSLLSSTNKVIKECGEVSQKTIFHQSRESRIANCVKNALLKRVTPLLQINGSRISTMNKVFEVERTDGANFTLEDGPHKRIARNEKGGEEIMEEEAEEEEKEPQDYMADFDKLSKKLTIRIKLMPGLILKMGRNTEGFRVGMELDERDFEDLQGRGESKKKLKKLKKFLPLLLIPIAIQFMLLPMVLGMLKMVAAKALMAGKLALMLVLFNAAYNAVVPQHEEHNTRVANDFYGYDGGIEYGSYINRRMERDRSLLQDIPYKAHR